MERKVIMTLDELEQADAIAFDKEMAELDAMPLLKGGYCPSCEWSQNNCHCVEYNLPLPE
jgi:hypothetical protein